MRAALPVRTEVAGGGLRGLMDRLRTAFTRGKIVRQDVEEDNLRRPANETNFRFPSPGSQTKPSVPQGPEENIYNIAYYSRDARRVMRHEVVSPADLPPSDLPPLAGIPPKHVHLGYYGDFDRKP